MNIDRILCIYYLNTYINMLFNSILVEGILEHLVIINEFVVEFSSPLDFGDTEGSWIYGIHDLAVYRPSGALLYLGKLKLFKS